MSLPLEAVQPAYKKTGRTAKPKKHTYKVLLAAWAVLIASGVWGTKLYSDHLRNKIASQIAEQNKEQLNAVQKEYESQVSELKASMESDMAKLQTKVDSLTEVLAFVKDSANSKTDNSNQLYTQLAEVKKKLDELQKNLDVLK